MTVSSPAFMVPSDDLMAVFASVVTYTATTNADGFIADIDPMLLQAMQVSCGICWLCFLLGAKASGSNAPLKAD